MLNDNIYSNSHNMATAAFFYEIEAGRQLPSREQTPEQLWAAFVDPVSRWDFYKRQLEDCDIHIVAVGGSREVAVPDLAADRSRLASTPGLWFRELLEPRLRNGFKAGQLEVCDIHIVAPASVSVDGSRQVREATAPQFPGSIFLDADRSRLASTPDSRFLKLLESRLHRDFEAEPLEDCVIHTAEKTIADALHKGPEAEVLEFLQGISLDADHPGFASFVFRCLARQGVVGTVSWRTELVCSGLASDSLPIRDAAAQAAEEWGDSEMRAILGRHSEPVYWLAEYIRKIIASF